MKPAAAPMRGASGREGEAEYSPRNIRGSTFPSKLPPAVTDPRFRHQVERLHQLGPRALGELLAELAAHPCCAAAVVNRVERYAEIIPDDLFVVGGDRWPALPLYEVRR